MSKEKLSDQIRDYVTRTVIEPARDRGAAEFSVVIGEVHRNLQYTNRVPSVCNALASKRFLEENGLTLERKEGPPSKLSTRVTYFYRFNRRPRDKEGTEARKSTFLPFRGIAKNVFRELGGAEEFLRREREQFYGPGKDPLDREDGPAR